MLFITRISTHTPLARRDRMRKFGMSGFVTFLLTRLLRGATGELTAMIRAVQDFYSHASCEARRSCRCCRRYRMKFLLTRLLRGATVTLIIRTNRGQDFYSHASCEARHRRHAQIAEHTSISTHTPLARRDGKTVPPPRYFDISTHTPLARRDCVLLLPHRLYIFLLTRLLRGATLL